MGVVLRGGHQCTFSAPMQQHTDILRIGDRVLCYSLWTLLRTSLTLRLLHLLEYPTESLLASSIDPQDVELIEV